MMYAADGVGLAAPQVRRERERESVPKFVCLFFCQSSCLSVSLSVRYCHSPSKLLDIRRFDIEVECVVLLIEDETMRLSAVGLTLRYLYLPFPCSSLLHIAVTCVRWE